MVSVRALMAAAAFLAPALAAGLSPEQIVTDLGALKGKAEAVKSTATGAGNNAPDAARVLGAVTDLNSEVIKLRHNAAGSTPIQDQATADKVAAAYHDFTATDFVNALASALQQAGAVGARDIDTPSPEAVLPTSVQVTRSSVGDLGKTLTEVSPPSADKINTDTQQFQQTVDQATGKAPNLSL